MIQILKRSWTTLELFFIRYIYEGILIRNKVRNFFYILFGPIYFQTLHSAIRWDLFSLLSKHKKMKESEIANHLGLEEKPVRIMLSTLTAIGLIKRQHHAHPENALYSNTLTTDLYLTKEREKSLIPIIEHYHHIVYKPMFHLSESMEQNTNIGLEELSGEEPTLYQRLAHEPKLEGIFQLAMEQISVQANRLLAKYVDFTDVKHVVDVGGGNGANLIAVAEQNPHIQGTVLDLESVTEKAKERINDAKMNQQIQTVAADCFTDPMPRNTDCFLFCHFLVIWSEEQNLSLLQKAYDSLQDGGKVVIFDIMEWDKRNGPLTAAAGSPYFLSLATGDGLIYSASEYENWLSKVGFQKTKRVLLPQDHVAVIGIK